MGKTILIGDDSPVIRQTLRKILETQEGWTVVAEALNGLEALDKAEELMPDLVILDMVMPKMNGVEVMRELKRFHPSLLLVLFTNFNDVSLTDLAVKAGADAVISKTASDTLLPRIHELLASA
jgi:DNA-binding NarL/FixJ family response regulator